MGDASDTNEVAPHEVMKQLTAEWDIRGIDLATLQLDARGTILPELGDTLLDDPVDELPPMVTRARDSSVGQIAPREVELRGTIGEGGMGIVYAAQQTPMRREVAVKGLRPDLKRPALATEQLLREARVTGALEHPNIVPVHALGRDENNKPLIIMKRIEGSSWIDLLEKSPACGALSSASSLQRHLEILIEVAKAVHFAHCRGVVHRDLKPENVMIGMFGEVYVVDWGIAVGLGTEEQAWDLPVASEQNTIAGTPGYMAPEMAAADGPHIDARTDVYLLGAVLHEVLTGLPPHEDDSIVLMLNRAYASLPPTYPDEVPQALGDIVTTAMSRVPEDRFQTASSFAAALLRFLKHRHSHELCEEATHRFAQLEQLVATSQDDPSSPADEEHGRVLYNTFQECRFGFAHALRIWHGNSAARERLQATVELMIDHELDHGSPGAAAALLSELPIAMPELAERVARRRAEQRETVHELDRLRRDADPTVADRTRAMLALVVAVTGGSILSTMGYVSRNGIYAVDHFDIALLQVVYLVGSIFLGVVKREEIFPNASNLRVQLTVLTVYATTTGLWLIAGMYALPFAQGFAMMMLASAAAWTVGALAVDRRLVSQAAAALCGLIGVLLLPHYAFECAAVAIFVGSFTIAIARWRTRSARDATPLSQRWSQRRAARELAKRQ